MNTLHEGQEFLLGVQIISREVGVKRVCVTHHEWRWENKKFVLVYPDIGLYALFPAAHLRPF